MTFRYRVLNFYINSRPVYPVFVHYVMRVIQLLFINLCSDGYVLSSSTVR